VILIPDPGLGNSAISTDITRHNLGTEV